MEWKVLRLTQELKKYDRSLFAKRQDGVIQIWRKADKFDAADLCYDQTESSIPMQFIVSLTRDWSLCTDSVDWGLEPVMAKIREMDSHTKTAFLDELRKNREREKELKDRRTRNDIRARAADLRKEFAQATNEVNTATLEKVESRRIKYGNC